MKTINKQTENMGGVLRLWAIPYLEVNISGRSVSILSDTNVVNIYVREDSASFAEDLSRSFKGSIYKTDLSALVPCDNSDTLALITEMERKAKYVVLFIDGNGNYKIAGSYKQPLRFSANQATGMGAASLNHYAIKFSGNQLRRAAFVDAPSGY